MTHYNIQKIQLFTGNFLKHCIGRIAMTHSVLPFLSLLLCKKQDRVLLQGNATSLSWYFWAIRVFHEALALQLCCQRLHVTLTTVYITNRSLTLTWWPLWMTPLVQWWHVRMRSLHVRLDSLQVGLHVSWTFLLFNISDTCYSIRCFDQSHIFADW